MKKRNVTGDTVVADADIERNEVFNVKVIPPVEQLDDVETVNGTHIIAQIATRGTVRVDREEKLSTTPLSEDMMDDYMQTVRRADLLSADEEIELAKTIEIGLFAHERLEVQADGLSAVEVAELQELIALGQHASERMVLANMQMVMERARAHRRGILSNLDLAQGGVLGLIKAVRGFDYKKGYRFYTYAAQWVDSGIQSVEGTHRPAMTVPSKVLMRARMLYPLRGELSQKLGREPTAQEIADFSFVSVEHVEQVLDTERYLISLDLPTGENGESLSGFIAEEMTEQNSLEERAHEMMRSEMLHRKLSALTDDERKVIILNFGLNGQFFSMRELEDMLDFTVDAIKERALSKLRHPSLAINEIDERTSYGEYWRNDALCKEVGINVFYRQTSTMAKGAKAICHACDVREKCLAYATETNQRNGMWAGLTQDELISRISEKNQQNNTNGGVERD